MLTNPPCGSWNSRYRTGSSSVRKLGRTDADHRGGDVERDRSLLLDVREHLAQDLEVALLRDRHHRVPASAVAARCSRTSATSSGGDSTTACPRNPSNRFTNDS